MWQYQAATGAALLSGTDAVAGPAVRRRDRQLPERGRLIDAGGYRIRIYEAGTSGPCVVIVPGAGDCAASWIPVTNQVAGFARVMVRFQLSPDHLRPFPQHPNAPRRSGSRCHPRRRTRRQSLKGWSG